MIRAQKKAPQPEPGCRNVRWPMEVSQPARAKRTRRRDDPAATCPSNQRLSKRFPVLSRPDLAWRHAAMAQNLVCAASRLVARKCDVADAALDGLDPRYGVHEPHGLDDYALVAESALE
jgi:hypothetical protein